MIFYNWIVLCSRVTSAEFHRGLAGLMELLSQWRHGERRVDSVKGRWGGLRREGSAGSEACPQGLTESLVGVCFLLCLLPAPG